MSIIQRQAVVVHRATNGEIPFSFNLELDFVPSSVIVRTIAYRRNTGSGLHGIKCSWLKARSGIIGILVGSANDDFVSNPNTTYKIDAGVGGALINGDVQFNLVKLGDNETEEQLDGVLALTLEFIKEDLPEPDNLLNEMKSLIEVLKKPKNDVFPFNPLPAQYGGKHDCMCGGEFTGDTRHALDQIDPIPDVNSTTMNVPIRPVDQQETLQTPLPESKKEEPKTI